VKLLMLPRYGRVGASSRLRTFQYRPWLEQAGIEVHVSPLLDDRYVEALYSRRRASSAVLGGYFRRVVELCASGGFDAVYIEKEALPWVPAAVERSLLSSNVRLVLDYDDAVFHRYDQHPSRIVRALFGHKLDQLMREADLVTVGNSYLGSRARSSGCARVELIPTVIDLNRYEAPLRAAAPNDEVVIGWIGSPSTAHYLQLVSQPLLELSRRHRLRCVAIGARADQLLGTPFSSAIWHEDTEVESLQTLDIGIMPLSDAPWERGKCGYKLIQYMACSLPVVASPVGVNVEIVDEGRSGFLADTPDTWMRRLEQLIMDAALRSQMGMIGRQIVETNFCIQVQGPRLAEMLLGLRER